eukprot:6459012-Amphidinium_carterae.3
MSVRDPNLSATELAEGHGVRGPDVRLSTIPACRARSWTQSRSMLWPGRMTWTPTPRLRFNPNQAPLVPGSPLSFLTLVRELALGNLLPLSWVRSLSCVPWCVS